MQLKDNSIVNVAIYINEEMEFMNEKVIEQLKLKQEPIKYNIFMSMGVYDKNKIEYLPPATYPVLIINLDLLGETGLKITYQHELADLIKTMSKYAVHVFNYGIHDFDQNEILHVRSIYIANENSKKNLIHYFSYALSERKSFLGHLHGNILLDFRGISGSLNGTTYHLINLFKSINSLKINDIFFLFNENSFNFHEDLKNWNFNVIFEDMIEKYRFNLAIRMNQPFESTNFLDLIISAKKIGFYFLDIISYECDYNSADIDFLWSLCTNNSILMFNSEFTKLCFENNFGKTNNYNTLVLSPSTNVLDYLPKDSIVEESANNDILIIGNKMKHKSLSTCVNYFSGLGKYQVDSIGLDDVEISDNEFLTKIKKAKVIIYPSFNEGFGLPIMQGLSMNKTVVIRDAPYNRNSSINIYKECFKFSSFVEIEKFIDSRLTKTKIDNYSLGDGHNWVGISSTLIKYLNDLNQDKIAEYNFSPYLFLIEIGKIRKIILDL